MQKLIHFCRNIKHQYLVKLPNEYQGFILLVMLIVIFLK